MTSNTDEEIERQYRYHIAVGGEVVCLSKTLLGIDGYVNEFKQNSEYRGIWVTVRDTFQEGQPIILQQEGGVAAPSAEVVQLFRK